MVKYIMRIMNMTGEEIKNHPTLMVAAVDRGHRIVFWNRQIVQYFGVSEEVAMGNVFEEVVPYVRNSCKIEYIERALAGESMYFPSETFDKTGVAYAQLVLPLKNFEGNVMAALTIIRPLSVDIIQKNQNNQQLFHVLSH